ncbi:unnamed protein product, partial [Polarella glacialis]
DWRALALLPPPADSAGFERSLCAACAEAATSQRGWSLSCAPRFLRSDRELALASVRRDGAALEFAEAMRADKQVALEAVRCSWHAMKFVAQELLQDRDILLAAVAQNGLVLATASEALRADRELVLTAVRQSWSALGWADE